MESLLGQDLQDGFRVAEILVVASGCTDGTDGIVQSFSSTHPHVRLIREPIRTGKASALNLILGRYDGDILVIVNGDACPCPGALRSLLTAFREDSALQVACGCPVPEGDRGGLPGIVQEFLWGIHNRTLQTLSDLKAANHCCDELMALRRGFVDSFPPDLINDGAYLGVLAAVSGQTVRFCRDARVHVHTPRSMHGLVEQRRRILRGHRQVRHILRRSPSTLEKLTRRNPALAVRILIEEIRDHPFALPVLLLMALPLELMSATLAASDEVRRPGYAHVWPKVDYL